MNHLLAPAIALVTVGFLVAHEARNTDRALVASDPTALTTPDRASQSAARKTRWESRPVVLAAPGMIP